MMGAVEQMAGHAEPPAAADNVVEPVPTTPAGRAAGSAVLDDPAIMASQMAAGAERERLERRVAELEAENTALRRTLAEMVKLGVDGLGPEPASPGRAGAGTA